MEAGCVGAEREGAYANMPPALVSSEVHLRAHLPPKHKLPRNKSSMRATDPPSKSGHQTFSQGTPGHN